MKGFQWGRGGEEWGVKVQGVRSINDKLKSQGEVKNSMGNGEAEELICMIHRHELRRVKGG